MVVRAYNPSYSGGWGRRIAWTQEAEVAVSRHRAIGTPAWVTRVKLCIEKNKTKQNKKNNSIHYSIKKKVKYLGIHLTKERWDLYTESYKILLRGIKDDLNKWRDTPCSWIGRVSTVKKTIPSSLSLESVPFLSSPSRRCSFWQKLTNWS